MKPNGHLQLYDNVDDKIYEKNVLNVNAAPKHVTSIQIETDRDDDNFYENTDFGNARSKRDDVLSDGTDDVTTDFSTDSFSPVPPSRKKKKKGSMSECDMLL